MKTGDKYIFTDDSKQYSLIYLGKNEFQGVLFCMFEEDGKKGGGGLLFYPSEIDDRFEKMS
jgi:hypothetical protein